MRTNRSVDSEIPLRGYLLSVGGALLLLLFAADWMLPAPLPSRFAESDPAPPWIRIHSDVKGPERVIIDTNQPQPVRAHENIAAPSQLQRFSAAEATQRPDLPVLIDIGDSRPMASSVSLQVRESLAQSAKDRASGRARAEAVSKRRRTFAHARSAERRRVVRNSRPDSTLGWCNLFSGETCRYASMSSRANRATVGF
jgi:hypothetical protein